MRSITRCLLSLTLLGVIVVRISASPLDVKELEDKFPFADDVDENYRLSYDVLPSNYKIRIEPFFESDANNEAFTFNGRVEITLRAAAASPPVTSIVLHAYDMEIQNYGFNTDTPNIPFNSSHFNATYDKWTIPYPAGNLPSTTDTRLVVDYVGHMRDDMRGFYRSYYIENGKKIWIGSTQFQPSHARRAFPCFDEPGIKATFDLRIIRPSSHSLTISNTKLKETTFLLDFPGKYVDDFLTTPKMSTYLLAFMITNYKGSLKNTGEFGVYARPEAQKMTEYAVEIGIEMLNILNTYFNISYYEDENVDKMDMAAVPDFSAGAMENWGLLTYRETNILYDNETSSHLNQQRIAAVIVHEQAHMWYGDLVSYKWWSETWMSESFARYFQYMGTAMFYPEWDLEAQFVVEQVQQAMQVDSVDSTHPMTAPVYTKSEASAIFDNISYNKGASVLRMLAYLVGHETFQRILQRHLRENKYGAVEPQDFFDAIRNETSTEMARFFESWTIKPGYPLVTVTLDGEVLRLTQKRFMRAGGSTNNKTERYNIPITIAMDNAGFDNHSVAFIFTDELENATRRLEAAPASYYMLNVQQTGFYRVNYDDDNWNKIAAVLHSADMDKIHVLNRAQVVDDLFNLARAGEVEYARAIDIVRYLKNETDYIPWYAAINQGLTFLAQRVKSADADIFEWFVRDLMAKIYAELTFEARENDRRTDIYNRVNILTWLCKYGHEDCVENSKRAFDGYLNAYKKAPRDHRQLIYCSAIRQASGDEEFNFLFDRFLSEDVAFEQLNILNALGCTRNERNIEKLLGRLIRTDDIRPQDRATTINAVLNSNPEGVDHLFNFITRNYGDWRKTMGDLATLTTVVGRFTSSEQLEKFEAFLADEKDGLGDLHATLSNAVATCKANFEWDEQYMTAFVKHLREISSAPASVVASLVLSVVTLISLYIF